MTRRELVTGEIETPSGRHEAVAESTSQFYWGWAVSTRALLESPAREGDGGSARDPVTDAGRAPSDRDRSL